MAVQTTHLVQKQIGSCRARAVPPLGTIENPPGDDRAGSAWAVPETRGYLTEVDAQYVEFATCSYQTERVRWYKPDDFVKNVPVSELGPPRIPTRQIQD